MTNIRVIIVTNFHQLNICVFLQFSKITWGIFATGIALPLSVLLHLQFGSLHLLLEHGSANSKAVVATNKTAIVIATDVMKFDLILFAPLQFPGNTEQSANSSKMILHRRS